MSSVWKDEDVRWHIKHPWKLPKLFFNNIKYSYQRITKGYCDKDLWDIDCWFMDIIPRMLQQFKETRCGSPGVLGEYYTDTDGILKNDICHKEWDKILDEMIFLFREMNEETCSRKNTYIEEYNRAPNECKVKYFEYEKELEEYRMECKDKAFALFSKWFYSLWD